MPVRNRPKPSAVAVLAAAAVAAATGLGAAGCGGGSGGGSQGSMTTADVAAAQTRVTGATSPCPFAFDVAAAAKKAGVTAAVTAGGQDGTTADSTVHPPEPAKPWPSGVTPDPAMPSVPAIPGWTDVECAYRVGAVSLNVLVVATPAARSAVNFLLPLLGHDNEAGASALAAFVKDLPKPGDVRLGPGSVPAAVVRIPVKGSGDIAMLVSQQADDGTGPLSSAAIRQITGDLAKEVHS
jgi:hypothetical protein